MWGANNHGQIGCDLPRDAMLSQPVELSPSAWGGEPVRSLHCGHVHTVVETASGSWWVIGGGFSEPRRFNDQVEAALPAGARIHALSLSLRHGAVLYAAPGEEG